VAFWLGFVLGGTRALSAAEPPPPAPAPPAPPPSAGAILVVGTNTPTDAATLNAAIANSPVGAEIVIRGTCLLNQTVRLLGNRSYRGESRSGTVLRQADGANLAALVASSVFLDNTDYTGTPIALRHLTLDGNRKNNPQAATAGLALRSWLSVVEDVHITGMGGDGIRLTSLSANGTVLKNTQVNGRIAGNFIEGSGRHGVFVEDPRNAVTDWILADNWIANSGADGIHLDNAAGWIIERNHIYGVPQNAIYAHRLFATAISNNYIEGFGEGPQAGTWHGIWASLQGGAASTITGNRIFNFGGEKNADSTYRYLAVSVNYGSGVVSVTGNAIRGAATPRGTGLLYTAKEGTTLLVTSAGNAVEEVHSKQSADPRVTLSAGL
jgi:hypothetical protein